MSEETIPTTGREYGKNAPWRKCETSMAMYPYLNEWEKKYVNLKAKGKSDREAFSLIGKDEKGKVPHCRTARTRAYIEMMKAEAAVVMAAENAENVMSMVERREFLAKVVRTPVGEVDSNHVLAQEVTKRYDSNGNMLSETVRMPSKLDAVELDAKLAGDLSNGGQVVVPVSLNFTSILGALPDTTGIPSATKIEVAPAQETLT